MPVGGIWQIGERAYKHPFAALQLVSNKGSEETFADLATVEPQWCAKDCNSEGQLVRLAAHANTFTNNVHLVCRERA